jgi:hypothetical protein
MFKSDRTINPRWMRCSCGLSPFLKPRPSLQRARITPIILFLSFTTSGAFDFLQLRISPSLPLSPSGQMRSLQVVRPMRIEVSQSSASEIEARLAWSVVSSIIAFLISTVSAASASASFESFEKSLKQRYRSDSQRAIRPLEQLGLVSSYYWQMKLNSSSEVF